MILLLLGGGLGDHLPLAAPFGGRRPALGANPIAAGFPVGADGSPMIIDFATTAVAAGKVQVARAAGAQLPPGSLLNRDGLPTTDPHDFYAGGMLLPFGAHKGFAVALMAEFLVAALVNPRGWEQEGRGGPVFGTSGLFMIAIDPAIFGTREDYDRIAQSIVQRIKSVPAAPGFAEVLMPGEPEMRARQQRLRGIPIEAATWHAVCTTAAELGVTPCQSLP
jgi:LDH2 family malate/lactate/ureidoglycolate dehydrogenase